MKRPSGDQSVTYFVLSETKTVSSLPAPLELL